MKHKPLFTSFQFLTTEIESKEGQSSRLEIRRTGNTQTQQTVVLKLDSGDISNDDLALPKVIFEEGVDRVFVNLELNKDGLWEGIEKGNIVVDKVIRQENIISDWLNTRVEVLINDLDSLHNGTGNHQSENNFGVAGAIQQRLAKEAYGDGLSSPGGSDREGARVISNEVIDQKTDKLNKRNLSDSYGHGANLLIMT